LVGHNVETVVETIDKINKSPAVQTILSYGLCAYDKHEKQGHLGRRSVSTINPRIICLSAVGAQASAAE